MLSSHTYYPLISQEVICCWNLTIKRKKKKLGMTLGSHDVGKTGSSRVRDYWPQRLLWKINFKGGLHTIMALGWNLRQADDSNYIFSSLKHLFVSTTTYEAVWIASRLISFLFSCTVLNRESVVRYQGDSSVLELSSCCDGQMTQWHRICTELMRPSPHLATSPPHPTYSEQLHQIFF